MDSNFSTQMQPRRSVSSAFLKPQYRRSLAFVGTSGLLFGVGFAGSSPAHSNGVVNCTDRIVSAAGKSATEQVDAIESMALAESTIAGEDIVCLNGNFVINDEIFLIDSTENVTFYGVGTSSSIEHSGGTVFTAAWPESLLTINNLTISGSDNAIFGYNVSIINSTFSNNTSTNQGAAIYATDTATISNSTFSNNTADDYGGAVLAAGNITVSNSSFSLNSSGKGGGAIATEGIITVSNSTFSENISENIDPEFGQGGALFASEVSVLNSTFVHNSAGSNGGAIRAFAVEVSNSTFDSNTSLNGGAIYSSYLDFNSGLTGSIDARNSTFLNNYADDEGGAIFAVEGVTYFSTFVNNIASNPLEDPEADTPGNAIYKTYGEFLLGGNIFAGESPHPQLGYGRAPTHFEDLGGNVFSNSAAVESDLARDPLGDDLEEKHPTSIFGARLISIFGTNTPALATFSPNSSGTQTIGLVAGSPALNIVPNDIPFETFDQRGATRSEPADAGAFEGVVALAKTGNETPIWTTIASAGLVALGSLALGLKSRLRRRKS
jgi:predicted outer membrane repeat protein